MWRNENRETVLHVVAKAGHVVAARTILAAMEETQAKDNRQLDVNSLRDKFGLTPVHVACNWGRADVLRLLMEYCGDVNFRDNIGQSALFW
jgi:ankyrin repeat protein